LKINTELREKLAESEEKIRENGITFDAVAREIDSLRGDLESIRAWKSELVDTVAVELGCGGTKIDIATEVSILKQKYDSLLERLEQTKGQVGAVEIPGVLMENISFSRDTALLDLAIDVMDGKITGIDVDRLRSLR
jgi:hypothetical protein